MYREISACRICGQTRLEPILHLGIQAFTGIFPRHESEDVPTMPIDLVKCADDGSEAFCGLVQLKHSANPEMMYGDNYGYRSGLNASMVAHLKGIVTRVRELVPLEPRDIVLDIGSNDSTLLRAYPADQLRLIGIDPTGVKFQAYYPDHVTLIPEFFSKSAFQKHFGPREKAKVITSISMFYDLEEPITFMKDIESVLADDGVWVFEQSYLPRMLEQVSYDTICHEHLEYYALRQVKWMTDRVGLKIIDLDFNEVNGGSFRVTVAKQASAHKEVAAEIKEVLAREEAAQLRVITGYRNFVEATARHREDLRKLLREARDRGEKVLGYGASTKGNVLLQYCGITREELPAIAEVNENKFGCFTPGTKIPILSEAQAHALSPDAFLVLPWHFKDSIIEREKKFLTSGGKLIFPLPHAHILPS